MWPSTITRLVACFTCGLMSGMVIFKRRENGHTGRQMSLLKPGVIKQTKLKLNVKTHPHTNDYASNLMGNVLNGFEGRELPMWIMFSCLVFNILLYL